MAGEHPPPAHTLTHSPYPFPLPIPLTKDHHCCKKTAHGRRSRFLHKLLRGNDGNREVAEPICDCPALMEAGVGLRAISALRPAAVPGMTAETPIGLVERSSCLSTPIPLAIFIENM